MAIVELESPYFLGQGSTYIFQALIKSQMKTVYRSIVIQEAASLQKFVSGGWRLSRRGRGTLCINKVSQHRVPEKKRVNYHEKNPHRQLPCRLD